MTILSRVFMPISSVRRSSSQPHMPVWELPLAAWPSTTRILRVPGQNHTAGIRVPYPQQLAEEQQSQVSVPVQRSRSPAVAVKWTMEAQSAIVMPGLARRTARRRIEKASLSYTSPSRRLGRR